MVSIAGSKKLKRHMAPAFWKISRKNKRFVVTVRPGAHRRAASVPTAVFLRDMLGAVKTLREAKSVIYAGKVKVDGIRRKSLHHGIGLMDAVELDGTGEAYRIVPLGGAILRPVKMADPSEAAKKICKVTSKTLVRGGKTALGFHDGRTLVTDEGARVGDSVIMQVPEQKVLEIVKLEKGCAAVVTSGVNAGRTGTVEDVKRGSFVLSAAVTIALDDRKVDVPAAIVMAVGSGTPAVQIGEQ